MRVIHLENRPPSFSGRTVAVLGVLRYAKASSMLEQSPFYMCNLPVGTELRSCG
jgi:hypothetical protein